MKAASPACAGSAMAGKAAPIPGATASPKENKRLVQKKLPTVLLRAGEDRFGEALVVQVNTAGMELLTPVLLEALEAELSPTTIVLKNDSPVRELEGLKRDVTIAKGDASGTVELVENGARFVADLSVGQKTGWFYDQRDNRRFMAGRGDGPRRPPCLRAHRRPQAPAAPPRAPTRCVAACATPAAMAASC